MLYSQKSRMAGAATQLQLQFKHHTKLKRLRDAAESGCYLCRVVSESLDERGKSSEQFEGDNFLIATIKPAQDRTPGIFHLDFRLDREIVANFVLKQHGESCAGDPLLL
jgi:hypothetical protein